MQRKIRAMFLEIVISSLILSVLDAMLSGILVFALAFFFLMFFNITPLFGLIPASLVMLFIFFRNLSNSKVKEIEMRYPNLNERLRTSRDYINVNNPIVQELNKEVLHFIRKVDVCSFLNPKSMFTRTVSIVTILFVITAISSTGFNLFDVTAYVESTGILDKFQGLFEEDNVTLLDDGDIYDDNGFFADIGNTEMEIEVESSYSDLDISKVGDPERNDFGGSYPVDVEADAEAGYQERIPTEHKEVIKKYFETIQGE